MRRAFIEIGVLKAISIAIMVVVAYIQPYLGGLAGALVFMSLQNNIGFTLKKAFQRIIGGWFLALIVIELLRFTIPFFIKDNIEIRDEFFFAVSLFAGFFSVPIMDFLFNKDGFKKLGGVLWHRFK